MSHKPLIHLILFFFLLGLSGCTNRVTVTFETFGGNDPNTVKIQSGDSLTLTVPTKEGHTFLGWYTDESYYYEFESNDPVSSDITLYAKWEINRYRLSYPGDNRTISRTLDYGKELPALSDPEKTGFTFDGFYLDESFQEPFDLTHMPAHNVRVHAKWLRNTYTISFDSNGGTAISDLVIDYDEPIDLPDRVLKHEHDFIGWHLDSDLTIPFTEERMPAENLRLHAKWEIHSYPLTYQTVGGTFISDDTFDYGEEIGSLPQPEKTGHTFQGWYLDASYYNPFHYQTMPGHAITVYAKWQVNEYSISYHELFKETIDQVYMGERHTIVSSSSNRLFSWGYNNYGQLGDGSKTTRYEPVEITPLFNLSANETILSISQADRHTLALSSNHRVFAWGYNLYGAVGDGKSSTVVKKPVDITSFFNLRWKECVTEVYATNMHSFALTSTGRVFAWGNNDNYQLGNGSKDREITPFDITPYFVLNASERITRLEVGKSNAFALTSEQRIFAWGLNTIGQLGNGTNDTQKTPLDITSFLSLNEGETITDIQTRNHYTFVVTSDHRVLSWGWNDHGQLANGTTINQSSPQDITDYFNFRSGEHIKELILGDEHALALTTDQRIFSWGNNQVGQLGDGTEIDRTYPTDITYQFGLNMEEAIESLYVSPFTTMVLTTEKRVFAFGSNSKGRLGLGSIKEVLDPTDLTKNLALAEDEHVTGINIDFLHAFIRTSHGRLIAFGYNNYGQLGNGTDDDVEIPSETRVDGWYEIDRIDLDYRQPIPTYIPTKEGYTFNGWYLDDRCINPLLHRIMPDHDLMLYAKYVPS